MPIPFKTIELGGKIYKLRFGMAAMLEMEQVTDIQLTELDENMSMTTIIKILWIMLKQEEDALTLKDTAVLIDENYDGNVVDLIKIIVDAVRLALPKPTNPKKPTVKKG
jgi:hypothetical protein